jgi:catecholate siderophore receptor
VDQPVAAKATSRLIPLGALAAGFGLFNTAAQAQTTPAPAPAAAASAPAGARPETTMQAITVKAQAETDATSVRAITSTIGKGNQDLRDIPQSVTVLTEKLMEDRRVDTLKQALHQTAGVSFMAAEGGEEDIRLRGFSLAASGDIYVDSLRDPAFYERDTFSYDRLELLRGSASMLFGRGSTGGVVNQVSKLPFLADASEVSLTGGTGGFMRFTGDFTVKTGERSGLRVNAMLNTATGGGGTDRLDKQGLAPSFRWGIGTADEFVLSGYYLHNNNGINYGLPWVRVNSKQATANPSTIDTSLDPRHVYYQATSDYNVSGATLGTFGHTHRFADGGELKSQIRRGRYDRNQRAGTIRFVGTQGLDTVGVGTLLTENGPNNKVQDMATTYGQSDYSNKFKWFGMDNSVLSGVDLAHEVFRNYAMVLPTGVTLNKNAIPILIGSPNTNSVDESLRIKRQAAAFDAKALGVYAQDLVQITPTWKLLGGLRHDIFKGNYQCTQVTTNCNSATFSTPVGTTITRGRSDGLWSKRAGALYQPNDEMSYYASWGTSFNTSGDTYQYDDQTQNTPPEGSENFEVGGKFDHFEGRLSARAAAFYSIKTNERNRDPDSAATQALLSGRRHAAGIELELAGRITPKWDVFSSYAWIPVARIDVGAPGSVPGVGEGAGTRSAVTPRHSGTFWTTYQITEGLRLGGGLNARASQTPNRNPAGIVAPHFVTGDLLAEYTVRTGLSFKLNVLNVSNKFYADSLYTAHYIPGAGRSVQATMTARF